MQSYQSSHSFQRSASVRPHSNGCVLALCGALRRLRLAADLEGRASDPDVSLNSVTRLPRAANGNLSVAVTALEAAAFRECRSNCPLILGLAWQGGIRNKHHVFVAANTPRT